MTKVLDSFVTKYINNIPVLPKYNPNATPEWIQKESGLPWLPLLISVPYEIILKEIANIESLMVAHRDDDYAEHHGWKSFCIHGKAYDATRNHWVYRDQRPYVWTTEAQQLMPNTVDFFKNHWPGSGYHRIRVMLLEPGGYIGIHRDSDASCLKGINIAITQPDECSFIMEHHGKLPFTTGKAIWTDTFNDHIVVNRSHERRWHIIVIQDFDKPEFQKLILDSYKDLYNQK